MNLLRTTLLTFLSVTILLSFPAFSMDTKKYHDTALMDKITQEVLKSEDPNNKDPKKRVLLNQLLAQIKDVNTALSSCENSLIELAFKYKSTFLLQSTLAKKPKAKTVLYGLVALLTHDPKEKNFSKQLIDRLIDLKDKKWNISALAAQQFTEKQEIQKEVVNFIFGFMNRAQKKEYQERVTNIQRGFHYFINGSSNPTDKNSFAQQEKNKLDHEAKRKKVQMDILELKLKNYKEAIKKRFAAEENIDIKAIGEIVDKAQEVTQEIQALQGAGDAGHAQQLAAWKKRLQQEKILQENTQKFARAQKKKLFQSMQTLSRNLKALRSDKAVIPANNGNKNSEVHAFTMQQIHRDPYWHAQYVGDVRAVEIRKAAEQEIQSHNDAQAWWTAHEKDNKHCMACYNHALAMAKPNVTQKQRRNSF